jgi:N-acetylmuramoyl-L-alanine amidase
MTDFSSEVAARTIYGEARGEGEAGMRAVAHVLVNRLKLGKWGNNLALVCLAPYQFSSWNFTDPNRKLMLALADNDTLLVAIRSYLADALAGDPDPTNGATFYFANSIPAPAWAAGATQTVQIGHQLFYRDVK